MVGWLVGWGGGVLSFGLCLNCIITFSLFLYILSTGFLSPTSPIVSQVYGMRGHMPESQFLEAVEQLSAAVNRFKTRLQALDMQQYQEAQDLVAQVSTALARTGKALANSPAVPPAAASLQAARALPLGL